MTDAATPDHPRAPRSRGATRSMLLAGATLAVGALALVACSKASSSSSSPTTTSTTSTTVNTPVSVPAWTPPVASSSLAADSPQPTTYQYGADQNDTLEVFQSSGDPEGTLIYIHGGGWTAGSAQQNTSTIVMAQDVQERLAEFQQLSSLAATNIQQQLMPHLQRGWDIVSINYELAASTVGAGVRGTQMMNDVDTAMRYIRYNAQKLGLDLTKVVLSGGSAGGHLALMEALTASSGQYMAPDLAPELKSVKVTFDGVIAMVAPTDMNTLWQGGYVAPASEESMLGCTPTPSNPAIPGMPACSEATLQQWSPLYLTQQIDAAGTTLPPAYFAYGGSDPMIQMATQGIPEIDAWAKAAGPNQTWYDYPPLGTHNIDDNVNGDALALFLDDIAAGNWSTLPVGSVVVMPTIPSTTTTSPS